MNVIIRTIPVLELIFSSSKYLVIGTTIEIGMYSVRSRLDLVNLDLVKYSI